MNTRVAVAGCGGWGRNLVRNYHELGVLAAVCDPAPETAAAIGEAFSVPVLPWERVLADADLAAVVIASPAACHFQMAREALEAGKHVFVEKPLALVPGEGEALVALARERERTLMVGHLLRYHPAFVRLQELVCEGELGRLRYVYSNRVNLGKVRRQENIIWSFAPHDISMILALAGEQPETVSAVSHNYLHNEISDVSTTHIKFASGINAHIFVSWLHPFKEQKLVAIGDQAMAVFDDGEPWERKLVLFRHHIQWRDGVPTAKRADGEPVMLTPQEPLRAECLHFLGCVTGDHPPLTDGVEALGVLRVLAAAQRSCTSGQPVAVAPSPASGAGVTPHAVVHETAVVDEGCTIGAGTRVWHFSHVLRGTTIGRDCVLGQNTMVGPNVSVGDRCKIQNNVSLYEGVTLEDGVFCGPSAVFTNVLTPRAEIERKAEFRPTLVRRGATIGANATIVCGVTLGRYCLVAAGAVVTKDVPDYALVAGVPARRIGWVSRSADRLGDDLVCPRTGARYQRVGPDELREAPGDEA